VDVLDQVGSIVNLKTEYVATKNPSTGVISCLHGDSECVGNQQQLCARQLYPDVSLWYEFVLCQSELFFFFFLL